jgi:myo-inositol-1(or 4)-monophosphatase
MINTPGLVLNYLYPFVLVCCRYAVGVQRATLMREEKSADLFAGPLTDVDLSIQNFIEVALLARFPEVCFYGEEEGHSLNSKYFSKEGEFKVLLDPIDGTRAFVDKGTHYQIIVSVVSERGYEGVLIVWPMLDSVAFALRNERTRFGKTSLSSTLEDIPFFVPCERGSLITIDEPFYEQVQSEFSEWRVTTPHRSYQQGQEPHGIHSMFHNSKIAAASASACQAIDWGAFAFAIQQAGGIATVEGGLPLNEFPFNSLILPRIVVGWESEVVKRLLDICSQ